ncbi:MAG: hypothetical protein JRI47_03950 [Deltaproteobacteria bacterium]|nr:hypothetical protein [Deltaproteobacteria bacterium]
MTGTAEGVERRKHQRIGVDGGIFIVMQPDTTKLGQVINIGQEGLAFRYMTDGVQWSGTSRLDLFVVGHDFYLEDIPFATIWDLATGKVVPWGSTTMRQRGLRFGELALPQRSRLAGFMWHQNPTMSLLTRQDS